MKEKAEEIRYNNNNWTASAFILTEPKYYESKSHKILKDIIANRTITINGKEYSYSTVAPAFALDSVFLIASECFRFAENFSWRNPLKIFNGAICGFAVILVGCFCVLEYLLSYVEFMFVSSVGIILFAFSLWDGSKFMAEKYIGAMLGFFIKLLFSTICIFLMLYLYVTLASSYTHRSFTGDVLQVIVLLFSSLLVFYICKSAPNLAQSLLSGTPSLSAAGAIGMVASTVMAASRFAHAQPSYSKAGTNSPQISSVTQSSISESPGVHMHQAAPNFAALPASEPYMAIENRTSDLTRSITYDNRPPPQTFIEGGYRSPAMLPAPSYGPGPNSSSGVTYEVIN
jgi:type IV secretory pathway TrbL component